MTFRECYTPEALAELLGISEAVVRDKINAGEIPHVRLNNYSRKAGPRKVVVLGSDLLAYLEHNRVPAAWQRPAPDRKPARAPLPRQLASGGPLGKCPY